MLGRVRGSFSRVVGFHLWKSMRDVEEWIEVEKGVKIKVTRPERSEEYHGRPFDRLTPISNQQKKISHLKRSSSYSLPERSSS